MRQRELWVNDWVELNDHVIACRLKVFGVFGAVLKDGDVFWGVSVRV